MYQLEKCSQDLGSNTKAVSSAVAQLLSEATQGNENYTGEHAIKQSTQLLFDSRWINPICWILILNSLLMVRFYVHSASEFSSGVPYP